MPTSFAHFRLIAMPCCGQMICWVNPRLPNYCPECGKYVFEEVRSGVTISDPHASIRFEAELGEEKKKQWQ